MITALQMLLPPELHFITLQNPSPPRTGARDNRPRSQSGPLIGKKEDESFTLILAVFVALIS